MIQSLKPLKSLSTSSVASALKDQNCAERKLNAEGSILSLNRMVLFFIYFMNDIVVRH